jgi:hypothetical protein
MSLTSDLECPITGDLFVDPVMTADGQTYERSAIQRWFDQGHRTSPATNLPLSSMALIPNIAMKRAADSARTGAGPGGVTVALPLAPPPSAVPFKGVRPQIGCRTLVGKNGKTYLNLQAYVPPQAVDEGTDYILCVDHSGSMETEAWVKVDKAEMGITRLNLVKQVLKVMAAMATPKDRFAVVGFNNVASVRLPLTSMDGAGQRRLTEVLDTFHAENGTNIYGAVEEAAKIASSDKCRGRRIVGVLLTDGVPSADIPPVTGGRSTMPMVAERIKVTNPWSFHAIGFSSDINSSLLEQLANWGQGRMLFVPSGDMVSTNAINLMAYEKTVASLGATVHYTVDGVRTTMETGPLGAGQRRDFMIPIAATAIIGPVEAVGGDAFTDLDSRDVADARRDCHETITEVLEHFALHYMAYGDMGPLISFMNGQLVAFHGRHAASTEPRVQAILRDVISKVDGEGQLRLALQHMRPAEWGCHYLRAYRDHMRAGICMNFKDPGLKIFETPEFLAYQAAGDTAFASIPSPPVVRRGHIDYSVPAPTVSYVFNNSSGSCFQGDTLVRLADDTTMAISVIQPGDLVWTPSGPAKVLHRVTFHTSQPSQPLVQFAPQTGVTPWHPCRTIDKDGIVGPWTFPANLQQFSARPLKTVYNLVLEKGHIIESGPYQFVTLGHGFEEEPLKHAFFGTQACVRALEAQPGVIHGLPVYQDCVAIKDPETGLIIGWEDALREESNVNGCRIA